MKLIAAEYFAGIGLVRMGLEACGWQIAYANDFSEKKFSMYKDFFPNEDHYQIEDIFKVDSKSIPFTLLSTCSFPCIDLSLAGNRDGIINGKHSSAFWGFIDILKKQGSEASPIVMVENVPGWLTSNNGDDFRITVEALNKLGYSCDVFTLDARRFTPQSRLRVFLIGVREKTDDGFDLILQRPTSFCPLIVKKNLIKNKDLSWFYNELGKPPELLRDGLHTIIEKMEENDKRWWTSDEVNRHISMMDKTHLERVKFLAQKNEISYRTFYRRKRNGIQRAEVRDDDIAGCLRTAIGGSGRQFLIKAGYGRISMRGLTPREYARLQGVPDKFPINVSTVQALTGFGDAVCVPAVTWIGENVINNLVKQYFPNEMIVMRFYGG